jgi:hypothetical protein
VVGVFATGTQGLVSAGPQLKGHDGFAARLRSSTQATCCFFPDWTMTCGRSGKGMSDFVQEGIDDQFFGVIVSVVAVQGNGFGPVVAATQTASVVAESESPTSFVESVLVKKVFCQGQQFDLVQRNTA